MPNIYCIAKNYPDHVGEMQRMEQAAGVRVAAPSDPIFFMKPSTALLDAAADGATFAYPAFSHDVHHEAELVVRIGRTASNIAQAEALACIDAYTLGIDFTARDIQTALKAKGHPWLLGKGFDGSAVVGRWHGAKGIDLENLDFALAIDGREAQRGNTAQMIHPIGEQIAYLSRFIALQPGDLLYTGTPSGVGPVGRGQVLTGTLGGQEAFRLLII